jgi:hypothetical protein
MMLFLLYRIVVEILLSHSSQVQNHAGLKATGRPIKQVKPPPPPDATDWRTFIEKESSEPFLDNIYYLNRKAFIPPDTFLDSLMSFHFTSLSGSAGIPFFLSFRAAQTFPSLHFTWIACAATFFYFFYF